MYPTNGGESCDGAMKEVRACNEAKYQKEECGLEAAVEDPVDCVYGEWSAWGACSASCGGGQTQRSRQINSRPENGGRTCDGLLEEIKGCNSHLCSEDQAPEEIAQNCVWEEWEEWGMRISLHDS